MVNVANQIHVANLICLYIIDSQNKEYLTKQLIWPT